jgi:hypothetical protein
LEVHSEFLRVNPQGKIITTDATPKPREILSPAVVRNGFASFHIVVRSPRPISYFLFVDTYPQKNVFRTAIYKEVFVNRGGEWIPDALKPLRHPNFDVIPDSEAGIPGQTANAYLLDVWVPPEAPFETVRLEVQLKIGDWVIYPMEVRILAARAPSIVRNAKALPEIEQRVDEAVTVPLLAYTGRHGEGPDPTRSPRANGKGQSDLTPPRTVRDVVRRNAEQDMALALLLDSKNLVPAMKQKMEAAAGNGGEWYLGIRDLIYRQLKSRTIP